MAEVKIIQKHGQPKLTAQGTRVPPYGLVVYQDESGVAECLNHIPVLMDNGHRLNVEQLTNVNPGAKKGFPGTEVIAARIGHVQAKKSPIYYYSKYGQKTREIAQLVVGVKLTRS